MPMREFESDGDDRSEILGGSERLLSLSAPSGLLPMTFSAMLSCSNLERFNRGDLRRATCEPLVVTKGYLMNTGVQSNSNTSENDKAENEDGDRIYAASSAKMCG